MYQLSTSNVTHTAAFQELSRLNVLEISVLDQSDHISFCIFNSPKALLDQSCQVYFWILAVKILKSTWPPWSNLGKNAAM